MKFLADMGVSGSVATALRAIGHDVAHARDRGMDRALDGVLMETARREQRVVMTFTPNPSQLGGYDQPGVAEFTKMRWSAPLPLTNR